jgi:hypothetical protein
MVAKMTPGQVLKGNVEYDLKNLVGCYMTTLNINNYIQHINLLFKTQVIYLFFN